MEEPGCGAQFRAAVQVIQGLPRSGAYRPSYEEMLRFYSYYKQATAGRCQGPRPGFWDPIGRYKWDAWHSLGAMSKEEAMAAYVAEMKKVAQKVIDTVPMDESTEEMFRYFEPLYEVIHDMPRPPESFFRSRGGPGLAPAPEALEGSQVTSDSEGDTFSDTLEQMEPEKVTEEALEALPPLPCPLCMAAPAWEPDKACRDTLLQLSVLRVTPGACSLSLGRCWGASPAPPIAVAGQVQGLTPKGVQAGAEPPEPHSAGQGERGEGRRAEGSSSTDLPALGSETDVRLAGGDAGSSPEPGPGLAAELEAHVASTVRALQEELRRVRERLSRLETLGAAQGEAAGTDPGLALAPQALSPWRLTVSPRTLLFLATWPFVTQWLLRHWQGRKR